MGWDVEVKKSVYWIGFAALRLEIHAIKLGDLTFLSISAQLVPKGCSLERVHHSVRLFFLTFILGAYFHCYRTVIIETDTGRQGHE